MLISHSSHRSMWRGNGVCGIGLGVFPDSFHLPSSSRSLVSSPFGWRLETKTQHGNLCGKIFWVRSVGDTLHSAQVLGHVDTSMGS